MHLHVGSIYSRLFILIQDKVIYQGSQICISLKKLCEFDLFYIKNIIRILQCYLKQTAYLLHCLKVSLPVYPLRFKIK